MVRSFAHRHRQVRACGRWASAAHSRDGAELVRSSNQVLTRATTNSPCAETCCISGPCAAAVCTPRRISKVVIDFAEIFPAAGRKNLFAARERNADQKDEISRGYLKCCARTKPCEERRAAGGV